MDMFPMIIFNSISRENIKKEEHRYHYTNFTYDAVSNSYVCPEGKRLTYWKTRTNTRPRAVNGIIKCTKGQSVEHVRNERYVPSQRYGNYSLIYENLF